MNNRMDLFDAYLYDKDKKSLLECIYALVSVSLNKQIASDVFDILNTNILKEEEEEEEEDSYCPYPGYDEDINNENYLEN